MEVNDEVVCNNTKPLQGNDVAPPLNEGETYTIKEIHVCKCGKQHFNVGLPMEVNYVRCHACQEELPATNHWAHPSRFTLK
jgi:hypothetical protein